MQETMKRYFTPQKERLAHIEKWRESKLSMSEYSREANIPFSRLSKWVRSENKSKFKPILVKPEVASKRLQDSVIEISVEDRIKIRLLNPINPSAIIDIVRGLMSCN
jgi:hypothetical protein